MTYKIYSKNAVKKRDYEADSKKRELERMYKEKMQNKAIIFRIYEHEYYGKYNNTAIK